MDTFDPTPYHVDPDDKIARGALLHAAGRGDRRARLTLKALKRAEPTAQAPTPNVGAVARGRDLARDRTRGLGTAVSEEGTDAG